MHRVLQEQCQTGRSVYPLSSSMRMLRDRFGQHVAARDLLRQQPEVCSLTELVISTSM